MNVEMKTFKQFVNKKSYTSRVKVVVEENTAYIEQQAEEERHSYKRSKRIAVVSTNKAYLLNDGRYRLVIEVGSDDLNQKAIGRSVKSLLNIIMEGGK